MSPQKTNHFPLQPYRIWSSKINRNLRRNVLILQHVIEHLQKACVTIFLRYLFSDRQNEWDTFFPHSPSLLLSAAPSWVCRVTRRLNQQGPRGRGAGAGWLRATCGQGRFCVTPGFGVSTCPREGGDHPVEIHTATPEGLSVFPLLYS